MLENAGLLPKGATPRRSHSESNLSTIASEDSDTPTRRIGVAGSSDSLSVSLILKSAVYYLHYAI